MQQGPGVVTGRYGSVGEVYYIESEYWPLNTTLFVSDFKGNYPKYVYYLLQAVDFKKYSDKTGVPGVNRNDLHRISTSRPPLEDQIAIANLLSTWDTAIEKTERLIAVKKNRFGWLVRDSLGRRHSGSTRHPLNQICEPVIRKNEVGETNVLTTSAQHGLVSQLDYYNKSVSAEDVSGYYLLKRGEFAYNRSSSNGYPYGVLIPPESDPVSDLLRTLCPNCFGRPRPTGRHVEGHVTRPSHSSANSSSISA